MVLSVRFTISNALLLLDPSTYSEKNNSLATPVPLVVLASTGVLCADVLPTASFACKVTEYVVEAVSPLMV